MLSFTYAYLFVDQYSFINFTLSKKHVALLGFAYDSMENSKFAYVYSDIIHNLVYNNDKFLVPSYQSISRAVRIPCNELLNKATFDRIANIYRREKRKDSRRETQELPTADYTSRVY